MKVILLFAFVLGCGTAPAALQLHSLSPQRLASSDAAALTIHGQGFMPTVSVDLDNRGRTSENTSFSATLLSATDSFALMKVSFESTTTLHAQAPALVPGSYALRVVTPDGTATTLGDALEVTQ